MVAAALALPGPGCRARDLTGSLEADVKARRAMGGAGALFPVLCCVWMLCWAPLAQAGSGAEPDDGELLFAQVSPEDRAAERARRRAAEQEVSALMDLRSETGRVYQITAPRWRYVRTPDWMLGAFLEQHGSHWTSHANMSWGGEFVIRDPGRQELVIGLDWTDLRMRDTFWLGRNDPIRKAEWTEFDIRLLNADVGFRGVTAIGRDGPFQLYYGAALGLGIVVGNIWQTQVDRFSCDPMPERASRDADVLIAPNGACFDDDGQPVLRDNRSAVKWLLPVMPSLELMAGARYVIADHYVIGTEIGFRSLYAFAGVNVGYQFRL